MFYKKLINMVTFQKNLIIFERGMFIISGCVDYSISEAVARF